MAGYHFYEGMSWLDAFWWTLVTICTVGYGDFFPSTTLGRLLVDRRGCLLASLAVLAVGDAIPPWVRAPQAIQAGVDHDPVQPGRERRAALETREIAAHLEE